MARISRLAVAHSPSVAAALSPDVLVRQPPGTVSMLFHKVPVLQVPRAWRWAPLDLHLDVELRPANDGAVTEHQAAEAELLSAEAAAKIAKAEFERQRADLALVADDLEALFALERDEVMSNAITT